MGEKKITWTAKENTGMFRRPGAVKEKDGICFTLSIPQGKEASLLLYQKGSSTAKMRIPFPKNPCLGNLYCIKVTGLLWREYEYTYEIDGVETVDPYAARVTGREVFGVQKNTENGEVRGAFSFENFNWKGDQHPKIPFEKGIMYHLHIRNYTMNRKSGVRHKGTFRGLQEKIPYLKSLGINQVKLMPVYEFDECPKLEGAKPSNVTYGKEPSMETAMILSSVTQQKMRMNCWGYGPGNYFAPKRSYAASKNETTEFKEMVKAFHENGMEVLLDFYFMPGESLRLITDCLLYWVQEYHVDGFHIFGSEGLCHFLASDPVFSNTKILSSYFAEEPGSEAVPWKNKAEINDGFLTDMRRILKGDEGAAESFAFRSRRNANGMAVINYMTNHDGFTLKDLVSYDAKHNEENGERNQDGCAWNFSWNCGIEGESKKKDIVSLRTRQMKNAFLLMMLSQGTPMLLAGDEFGNTQKGNNNPYCLDNETSWVSWNRFNGNRRMVEFVQKAIAFRMEHDILHMKEPLHMADVKSCGYPDLSYHSDRAWYGGFEFNSRQLGMLYCGSYAGEEEFLYIAYNFHSLTQNLALPKLPEAMRWQVEIDTSREDSFLTENEFLEEPARIYAAPARSVTVLRGTAVKEERMK